MSAKAAWACREAGAWLTRLVLTLTLSLTTQAACAADSATPATSVNTATPSTGAGLVRETDLEPLVVGLVLNGTAVADGLLVYREPAGQRRLWLPAVDMREWRLSSRDRDQRNITGMPHVAFCDGRERCFYDENSALLTLQVANTDLLSLQFAAGRAPAPKPAAPPTSVGAFLNYDVTALSGKRPALITLLEGHAYTPHGQGLARLTGLVRQGHSTRTLAQATWQIDRPDKGLSVQAGSIAVPDTTFAAGLPLTGLRVGSNSRLQPSQVSMAMPTLNGLAERSLRADVFVDGLFRQTVQVPYGPYSVDVLPQYPGRGTMDLLTTDISGRQTRLSVPYYMTPNVLAPGTHVWSADVGVMAPDGTQQTGPRPGVLSLAWRGGLSAQITPQAQAMVSSHTSRLVLGVDAATPQFGWTSVSLTDQRTPAAPRGTTWLGFGQDFQSRDINLGMRLERAVSRRDGGLQDSSVSGSAATGATMSDRMARPLSQLTLSAGANLTRGWSLTALLDRQRMNEDDRREVRSLSLRYSAGANSQLAFGMQRLDINGQVSNRALLSWSQPLGQGYSGQVGLARDDRQGTALQWSAQSLPPADAAVAAQRLQTYGTLGPNADIGARWSERTQQLDWRAEGVVRREGFLGSMGASGAVGVAEGRVFASRRIDDAFIVVDAGLPDLPVLLDNREVARTNAAGWAVVTEARAHQSNVVGIDITALPIQYAVPRDQLSVVPSSAAGILAGFDVSDGGISLAVTDPVGKPIPAGARARVSSQRLSTAVTSRSEIYIDRSDRGAEIVVEWEGKRCRFEYRPQEDSASAYRCVAS